MFGRGFKIGTIGGVPIRLDGSWIFIAVLVVYTFYIRTSTGQVGVTSERALVLSLVGAALFFGSVLVHEGAHAVTARALGLEVGGITLVFWGGFTETRADRRGPKGEFLVSAAGPFSSLVLAGLFFAGSRVVADPLLAEMFDYLAWVNGFLAVLNALPGLPLDGGRVLLAIIWKATGNRASAVRAASVVGILIGGALLAYGALRLLRGDVVDGIWAGFIGMTMIGAARSAQGREELRRFLTGGRVRDAMQPPPPTVEADLALSDVLDRYLRDHEEDSFPVVDGDTVLGVVSFESARRVGASDPLRPARDGMVPVDEVVVVQADDGLDEALDTLGPGRAGLVLDGDRLVGSIRPSDIQRWLDGGAGRIIAGGPSSEDEARFVPPRPD